MPFSLALLCTILGVLTYNVQAQDPTPDPPHAINTPISVSHFDYVSCVSISFSAFTCANEDEDPVLRQVEQWEFMSINQCISDCYHAAYAAVSNETCYCSTSPDALDIAVPSSTLDDTACSIPCLGNAEQACGGPLSKTSTAISPDAAEVENGAEPTTILLSIYRNTRYNPPHHELFRPRAVSMITPNSPDPTIIPTAISTTYTILCTPPICPSATLSETATTITALFTRTSPEVVARISMTIAEVTWIDSDGEGKKERVISTRIEVPDEVVIERPRERWEREWMDDQRETSFKRLEMEQGLGDLDNVDAVGDRDEVLRKKVEMETAAHKNEVSRVETIREIAGLNDSDGEDLGIADEEHGSVPADADEDDALHPDDADSDPQRSLERGSYQALRNTHERSFAGIGGLGNVQIMPAQGHWQKSQDVGFLHRKINDEPGKVDLEEEDLSGRVCCPMHSSLDA